MKYTLEYYDSGEHWKTKFDSENGTSLVSMVKECLETECNEPSKTSFTLSDAEGNIILTDSDLN